MKRIVATGLLLSVALGLAAQGAERVAVVVGVNRYDRLTPLRAAELDARNVAAHYQAAGFSYVWTLTEDATSPSARPSLVNFQILMENVEKLAQSQPIEELVVFFAGHGVQIQGENFLCFPEADLQGKRGILSVDRELVPWLRRVPTRLTLTFLDACREDLGPTRSASMTRGLVIPESLGTDKERNILIAYSARPGEFAYEKPDGSGGFFTEVLLEGLRRSTRVSLGDLIQYLRVELPQRTRQVFGKIQMPSFGGDFLPEATLTSSTRSASFGEATLRILSDRPVSQVFVNGAEASRNAAEVEVRPGEYRVRVVSGDEFWETDLMVSGAGAVTVIPDWKPFGRLEYVLPPAAEVELEHEGGTLVLLENRGVVPYLEAGSWTARALGKAYHPWQDSLRVERGQVVRLQPSLKPRPGSERLIRLAALEWERETTRARLPEAAQIRQSTAWVPWAAGGTGAFFVLAGAGLWGWSELAYQDYTKATTSQAAQSARELVQALDVWKLVSLGLGGAGLAAWAVYEGLNPAPASLERSIQALDEQIRRLREES